MAKLPIPGVPPIPGIPGPKDLPTLRIDGEFAPDIKAPQLSFADLEKLDLLDAKLELGIRLPPGKITLGFTLQELKPSIEFCGFKLGITIPGLSFHLPPINFPPRIDLVISFDLALGISCNLENPISITGGVKFGGGRKSNVDPDPDDQYADAA